MRFALEMMRFTGACSHMSSLLVQVLTEMSIHNFTLTYCPYHANCSLHHMTTSVLLLRSFESRSGPSSVTLLFPVVNTKCQPPTPVPPLLHTPQ